MSKRQLPLFPNQPATPEDISKHTPIGATFDLFGDYLRREGKSEHTIKAFNGDLLLLTTFTSEMTPVSRYTTTGLNEFLNWMEHGRGVPCSRKTYARRVTSLKVFFKWLHKLGAIPHDPAKAILQRSGPAPLSHVLTYDDIKAASEAAAAIKKGDVTDNRPLFLFMLLLETGIKKSEAGRLKLEDFDRSNPQRPTVIIKHKARNVYKERRIEVTPELVSVLDAYAVQYGLKEDVFTCTTRNLEYILTDVGKDADIPFKLSFEVMRWTSAVHDAAKGMEEDAIRDKLGLSKTSWYETSNKIQKLLTRIKPEKAEESAERQ